ncbi:NAD-aldehyde dehydrogenase [Laccaria bicolor S238N-H82]|uniref:NAD-aldehyde dehydrogenase n=1 Tax=Laccaria bicolor (strain S238N-H82 / ATCC MYA-4686) TaxID=486041 RepID=B0D7X7_LACBS|nr:NAD-aldehyde dehydrogenase [Laccaria bicolor S238N-H82]EDR09482.1 NAD-aldehyde dehydrogenase [Laccaria bicolor S238N-H82]|eukprot:XP_001879831.1 NAD-aldehyde dehydrogenase [Laccaria bicolor S238N-H82]
MSIQTTISPHNQKPYVSRIYPTKDELDVIVKNAATAQKLWSGVPVNERVLIGRKFMDEFRKMKDEIPLELSLQMGRPVSQGAGEVRGVLERAEYMLSVAESSLADVSLADTDKPGFKRYIKRTPLGVVLVIAPWNFPYLVSINSVLPAIIAGNAVLLKPSPQTPLTAERFALALTQAGVPKDVIQVVHLSPSLTTHVIQHPSIDFVSFTGSVSGGRSIAETAAKASGFTGVALELGGKDPAYVASDANLDYTAGELVDGAFFNSGQSCCSVEASSRVYVHESIYEEFVKRFVEITKTYKLGDPTLSETNLGPVVSLASAERIRKQIDDAVKAGAKALISEQLFPFAKSGTTYVAPQVLVDVNHSMDVMMEETFGPVVGIQSVASVDEAVRLMNDSPYGLTASVWTDVEANPQSEVFNKFVNELETGTVFLNSRCDYLDPALAWTGVKDSGRGVSLSKFGYDQVTRAKSVHMKIRTT